MDNSSKDEKSKVDKISLIVVGESSVGKTAFLNRYSF